MDILGAFSLISDALFSTKPFICLTNDTTHKFLHTLLHINNSHLLATCFKKPWFNDTPSLKVTGEVTYCLYLSKRYVWVHEYKCAGVCKCTHSPCVSYRFWCIRLPHQSLLVQWGHQCDTNPPLMRLASEEKHWHFALRPSLFPPATHGRTLTPVRCSFIPTLVRRGPGFRWLAD